MTAGDAPDQQRQPLGWRRKLVLFVQIWREHLVVQRDLRRMPLPQLVDAYARSSRSRADHPPRRLSRAVGRSLRIGPWQPRCLPRSLVLFRLLRAQGEAAELVIGLPREASSSDAHAWVEIDGRVVGPPPGRLGHEELVRYPLPEAGREGGAAAAPARIG
jgi:hypothetical protein